MKGKFMKKTFSLMLVLVMALSLVVFTSVPASAQEPVFSEDFTTWTADNFSEKLTAGGWSGDNNGAALSADANLKANYNGHTTTGYSVGSNNILKTTFADSPITTGKYEVKIKFNPGKEPNANIYLGGSEPSFTKWNAISSDDYLFGANFRWNGFTKDETGAALGSKDTTGSSFLVGENSMRNNHWRDNAGEFKYNKWYDLSVKADFETRLVHMALYEEGATAPVAEHRYVMSSSAALGTIMFTNNNNPFVVETITVTPMSENVTQLANETFDDATIIADWDINVKGGHKSLMSSFWTVEKGGRDSHIIDKTAADGTKAFHFDTTTFAADEAHKTALGFKQNAQNLQYDLVNPLSSGRVELSYDYYDVNGSAKPLVAITEGDTAGDDYAMLLSSQSNEIYPFWRPGKGYPILGEVSGKWYTVNVVVDLEKDTQDLTVSLGDKQIFKIIDQPLIKADSLVAPSQIDAIRILNWGGTNPFYIDNFKINVLTGEKETVDYITVYEDNFNDAATMDDIFARGWREPKNTGAAGLVAEGDNKYVKIEGNADVVGGFEKDFAYDKTTGKYRFTFDAKVGAGAKGIYGFIDINSWSEIGVLVNLGQTEVGHSNHNVDNGSEVLGKTTPGAWIRVETVVDLSKKEIVYTLKDIETNAILNTYTNTAFKSTDNLVMDGARSFKMMSYGGKTAEDNTVYLDNLKIEYGYGKPELSAEYVTMTDYKGAAIEGITNITPGVKTIALDFRDAVTEESVAENISLSGVDKDGKTDNVAISGQLSGSKYVISTPVLMGDATYTLTVGENVANSIGLTLGKEFTYTFTTGKGFCKATADGVYAGAMKCNSVGEIKAAEVTQISVKANAENITRDDEIISVIVAYYSGNMLVKTELKEVTVKSGATDSISESFTLPDMTNVTTVKAFLWNNATDLMPYCGVTVLPAE